MRVLSLTYSLMFHENSIPCNAITINQLGELVCNPLSLELYI